MISLKSPIVNIAIFAVLLTLTPAISFSDTIKLQGKVYDNVYVSPGTSTYYVRFADDGSLVSIPNSEVRSKDVVLSDTAEERKAISKAWKAKRRTAQSHKTLTYEEWRQKVMRRKKVPVESPKTAITPSRSATKPLSNASVRKSRSRYQGDVKKFVNAEGVSAMTNMPRHFKGKPEYLEVDFDYKTIVVPEMFKGVTASAAPNGTIDEIITFYAKKNRLDKALVYAVIKQESNGNPKAISRAGARGLMQLMPGTAQDMGVYNIFDPAENIAGGTQYLSKMSELFDGDINLILAGYNAGPGNVKKYKGVPPFEETENYVRRVQQLQQQYKRHGMPRFAKLASLK